MARLLTNLRNWAIIGKTKKTPDQDKSLIDRGETETSFQHLPNEMLEKIFQHLPQRDILLCRRVCTFLRIRVDQLYTKNSQLILNDRIYSHRPSQPLYFAFFKLTVQKLTNSKMSGSFFKQNFSYVTELDCSDIINTKVFPKLLESTPNLRILRMNSVMMGGSKNLQLGSSKDKINEIVSNSIPLPQETLEWPLRISEIHLLLEYVPGFHKGFSCQILIQNLLGMRNWNTPFLDTISFKVEPSSLMEQFYFSLDTFLSSIPFVSYESLTTLKINTPTLHPSKSRRLLSNYPELLNIQLHNLSFHVSNFNGSSLSSDFTQFLHAQRNLVTLDLNIQHDHIVQELLSHLIKQNDGLQVTTKKISNFQL